MTVSLKVAQSRRAFIRNGLIAGAGVALTGFARGADGDLAAGKPIIDTNFAKPPVPSAPATPAATPAPAAVAAAPSAPKGVRPELFDRAMASLDKHKSRFAKRDVIAIADFTPSSAKARLQVVNLEDGSVHPMLVAHGSGSDPSHTGYLKSFSNEPDSDATCEGAFALSNYYTGKHGHSQRIEGLDPTNSNALDRAIVIHAAWYADADMIEKHGQLGRSQGCFAVGDNYRDKLFAMLGEGRMLFAGKV